MLIAYRFVGPRRLDSGVLPDFTQSAARAAAESLAPFRKKIGTRAELLGAALDVAASLGIAATATMLLEPFRVQTVTQEHAGGLAAAAGRYGEDWTRGVIDGWFGPGHHYGTDEWVNKLPGLCGALRAAGRPEVAQLLAAGAWRWMSDQLRLWTTTPRSEVRQPRLDKLSSPLVRLLEAADHTLAVDAGTRSPGTLDTYRSIFRQHVKPALDELQVQEVKTPAVDRALTVIKKRNGQRCPNREDRRLGHDAAGGQARRGDGQPGPRGWPDRQQPKRPPRSLTAEERLPGPRGWWASGGSNPEPAD
ncbi:MAG: hypothetical protein H0V92_08410 [Pseudonocardiales bacterium]|nr:hypothetical protein [Pseudonocardiales bacterium]